MNVSPSKENILKKIRKALSASTPLPFPRSEGNSPVFQPPVKELEMEFAEEFTRLQGRFLYCADTHELGAQLALLIKEFGWNNIYSNEEAVTTLLSGDGIAGLQAADLASADVSITSCECLVARTGSILLSSAGSYGRAASVYAPVHICIAYTDQLVYDIKDGLQLVREKYGDKFPSVVSLATGPSRTADIEKTLVVGVHGPKEVYLFLVER